MRWFQAMERRGLDAGISPDRVARSWSDYEDKTNARRNNEEHIFERAMQTHVKRHLLLVKVKARNGHVYDKYLPIPLEG